MITCRNQTVTPRRRLSEDLAERPLSAIIDGTCPPDAALPPEGEFAEQSAVSRLTSGIGDATADVLDRTGLPALVLAFLMALTLRAAQGSTTVALIATAGILTPLLQRADLSTAQLSLVALAMGAGGLSVSHINDAGYWMSTKPTGLDVASGLRTWTVLTSAMGLMSFGLTAALWPPV